MAYIAHEFMECMGYGDQPYIVFLHEDTGRRHLHIVSVRVDEEGHELPYRFDLKRAMAHCREMERKYGLRPPQAGKTTAETLSSLRKVEYPSDDFTTRLRSTARAVIESYRYHSLGELNTVLELFNIRIEEIRGQHAGQEFHGLVYGVLDDNDRRIGPTVKASRLGPAFG